MRIGHKSILGFVGIALLIWVVGYISVNISQKALREEIGKNSVTLAKETLDKVDREIYHKIEVLQAYANDLILRKLLIKSNQEFEKLANIDDYIKQKDREWTSAPKGIMTPFMEELTNNELATELKEEIGFYKGEYGQRIFPEIYATNRYGVIIGSTGRTSDYLQADEQWYQKAVAEKAFWVGNVEYDESSDTYALDIVVNLYDDEGNFLGILKAVLDIQEVINIMKQIEAAVEYDTTEFKLITKDRKIIYSTEDFRLFEDVSKELFSRFEQEGEHTEYFIAEGDKLGEGQELFAHAHSKGHGDYKGLGWTLIVEHKTEEIFAPVAKLKNILLIISFIVTTFAVLIGLFISRSISTPIKKLKAAAAEIGKGKLDTKIDISSKNEIGKLAQSFNEMTYKLKEFHANLEKKVQERTSELTSANVKLGEKVDVHTSAQKTLEQRLKVINCLYDLSKLIERPKISLEQIFQETVHLIRKAYRYPHVTCVRITFDGIKYKTDNFKKTELSQCAHIKIQEDKAGTIEVYYLGEKAEGDKPPFLKEERDLLDAIAEHLGGIAGRKQTGEKLELFRNLIDRSNDCIFVIDPQWGRFLDANDQASESLGYTREELLGMAFRNIEQSIPDDSSWQEQRKQLDIEGDVVIQGQHRRKDGTTFFVETSLKLLSQKKRDYIVAVARDITERKQAEEAAALAYTKLEEANGELKETQSQLVQSEKMASIGQLAAGVAHEMNTPVGFVTSNFKTLEGYVTKFKSLLELYDKLVGGIDDSEKTELLDKANAISKSRDDMKIDFILEDLQELFDDSREGLDRVTNIIQNLRDFSRIDQAEEFDEYDLNAGIEATLVVAGNEIKYDADVKTDLSKMPHIYCNASQVNQVFLNVLVNAAQAIKSKEREDKGTITIRTYATDDQAVCEISDNGTGIASENLPRVFDPFFTTKPVGSGTGLGLSVSYDIIVNKHKGELLADSTVGEGTTFTIKLPIGRQNATDKDKIEKDIKEDCISCR